jgi:hypothetical protein
MVTDGTALTWPCRVFSINRFSPAGATGRLNAVSAAESLHGRPQKKTFQRS